MAGTIEKKLTDLGIVLPQPVAPVANYVGFVRTGSLLVVSGQLCLDGDGKLVAKGRVADVMRSCNASSVGEAFSKLTGRASTTAGENPS